MKKATLLKSPKVGTDPTAELHRLVDLLEGYEVQLVLAFVKNLFDFKTGPNGQAAEEVAWQEEAENSHAA